MVVVVVGFLIVKNIFGKYPNVRISFALNQNRDMKETAGWGSRQQKIFRSSDAVGSRRIYIKSTSVLHTTNFPRIAPYAMPSSQIINKIVTICNAVHRRYEAPSKLLFGLVPDGEYSNLKHAIYASRLHHREKLCTYVWARGFGY